MRARASKAPPGRISYVNGRYLPHAQAVVHIEDRGLQFGDSAFELCRVYSSQVLELNLHIDRLEQSLGKLEISAPTSRAALALIVMEVVRRNRVTHGLAHIQVTRGATARDFPIPISSAKASLLITAWPIDDSLVHALRTTGVAVVTVPDQRWARAGVGSTQHLANVLAATEARKRAAHEAWFVDANGQISDGASGEAYIVDENGALLVRKLPGEDIATVGRMAIIDTADEAEVRRLERNFTPEEIKRASEAFCFSVEYGIVPVISVDGAIVGSGQPGPVTIRLQQQEEF